MATINYFGEESFTLDMIPLEGYNLGKELKRMREEESIPQRKIYDSGKFKQSHISNVENGKAEPDIEILREYSKLLNIDFYTLILKAVNAYEKHLMEKVNHNKALKAILDKKSVSVN